MRYQLKFLQRAGLVSALLIVGVLGGLMAPLPSEAGTPAAGTLSLSLKLDTGTAISFLSAADTSTTCTTGALSQTASGYTACYRIKIDGTAVVTGNGGRQYKVLANGTAAGARLLVGDNVGGDKFQLVGVKFVPVQADWANVTPTFANTIESHILTITMRNVFDSNVNVNNATTYVWGMRMGGAFAAGGASCTISATNSDGLCDGISDRVEYSGRGIFSPTLTADILSPPGSNNNNPVVKNSLPLSFTIGGPHEDPVLTWDGLTNTTLGQVDPTYPRFACDLDGAGTGTVCKPDITITTKATMYGPDTFVVLAGTDAFCQRCSDTFTPTEQTMLKIDKAILSLLKFLRPISPPRIVVNIIDPAIAYLAPIVAAGSTPPSDPECPGATIIGLNMATAAATDAVNCITLKCVTAVPAPKTGTMVIRMYADVGTAEGVADFEATGFEMVPGIFSLDSTQTIAGKRTFTGLTTGVGGGAREIREIDFPVNHDNSGVSVWFLNSVVCEGTGTSLEEGQVTELFVGETRNGVRVNYVNDNQTVTCSFDNHHTHQGVPSTFHNPEGAHTTNIVEQDLIPPPFL